MSDLQIVRSDLEKFEEFSKSLIELPVSHIWRGYGSALFLEFGNLTPHFLKTGRRMKNDQGEMGLGIEWSWRIEDEHSILAGSWSEEEGWNHFFECLKGTHVTGVQLFGRLPEVQLSFSNGMYLCSMMTADGDTSWWLSKRKDGTTVSVSVISGSLVWESTIDDADPKER